MAEVNDDFLNRWASRIVAMMREQGDQHQQLATEAERLQTQFDITSILNSPMSQPPMSPQQHRLQQIASPRPLPPPSPQQQHRLQQIASPRPLPPPSQQEILSPHQLTSPTCYVQAQPPTVTATTVCVDSSTDFSNMNGNMKRENEDVVDDFDLFSDFSEASDSDNEDPRQLWNDDNKKKEYEELKREYTKHDLRLCNKNGTIIKTVKIYSQNKNNFPVLVYDKRSYDAILNLSKSLKEKLDLKAKIIQEIYNLNQGINYIKYNSEQRGKRMRSVKQKRKEK